MKSAIIVRPAVPADVDAIFELLELYTASGVVLKRSKDDIASYLKNFIVAEENGKIVSSCTVVIIENLTHDNRPFAIIENVVTHENYRQKGLATKCIEYACEYARVHNCYKIMLMSSSQKCDAHALYKKCDFNSDDKTGFVKWL